VIPSYSYTDIPGHTNTTDFAFLRQVCEDAPAAGVLLEIGCLFGRSTVFFAETMRELNKKYEIYALDFFPTNWSDINLSGLQGNTDVLTSAVENNTSAFDVMQNFCLGFPEIKPLKHNLFHPMPEPLHNKRFAVVFEDTEHTYESTKHCLETYFPMLEENGIFCGDDYDWLHGKKRPGKNKLSLRDAVTEYAKKNKLGIITDNKIWRLVK